LVGALDLDSQVEGCWLFRHGFLADLRGGRDIERLRKHAFEFPFVITNPSHIFAIRNVRWACQVDRVAWEGNGGIANLALASGTTKVIEAGQVLNIDCLKSVLNLAFKPVLTEGLIFIALEYDADFFGLFSLHRKPIPTKFTWQATASNPQWIKGDFAR
jgi:hypothetical protein